MQHVTSSSPLLLSLFFLLCSASCSTIQSPLEQKKSELPIPPEGSDEDIEVSSTQAPESPCPTPFMTVSEEMCKDTSSSYGLSAETPAEWGFGAGTRTLWFGRLTCPSGAMAEITHIESIEASTTSSTQKSPMATEEPDVIDIWEVNCPGTTPPTKIFHNMYRCGNPCPPQGTKLLPAAAYQLYIESYKAHEAAAHEDALELARQAYEQAPNFELLTLWLALLSHESGYYQDAINLYADVLTFKPSDTFSKLQQAILYNAINQPEDALLITEPLLNSLTREDPAYSDALCAHATALMSSEPNQAKLMAIEACSAGTKACC